MSKEFGIDIDRIGKDKIDITIRKDVNITIQYFITIDETGLLIEGNTDASLDFFPSKVVAIYVVKRG